ncbi:ArsR family transcriptional regulator [Candidatus Nanohalobium constans]|uniref:TrmB family transcriptional regulator n=1 Tax=Candidatus Nanohalobium constans TaxID=2565781 RepID=A0A5Q0UH69_9ARCH|nr:ArsR family transcriptional regulator [Candidatus Nanohalobium constans]QGA80711.1 TrmB family transcriptional regulator [Candidatus Nanohalobium constans]
MKQDSMECPTEIKELLKVLYNLSTSETEVMYYLCEKEARASEIAEDLNKDRSTVQRYLSKLRATGLVERESIVEEGRKGRHYVYSVSDKEEMKEKVRKRMKEWEEEKLSVLDKI